MPRVATSSLAWLAQHLRRPAHPSLLSEGAAKVICDIIGLLDTGFALPMSLPGAGEAATHDTSLAHHDTTPQNLDTPRLM